MNSTPRRKRASVIRPAYLRSDVFDVLCAKHRAFTDSQRAALFDLDRGTVYRLRTHRSEATVSTAIHIAQVLGTTTEALFGADAVKADAKAAPAVAA